MNIYIYIFMNIYIYICTTHVYTYLYIHMYVCIQIVYTYIITAFKAADVGETQALIQVLSLFSPDVFTTKGIKGPQY